MKYTKESTTREVPASIDTETNRGLRATVYRFDKNGKVIQEIPPYLALGVREKLEKLFDRGVDFNCSEVKRG